jgi:hypothetical protein
MEDFDIRLEEIKNRILLADQNSYGYFAVRAIQDLIDLLIEERLLKTQLNKQV